MRKTLNRQPKITPKKTVKIIIKKKNTKLVEGKKDLSINEKEMKEIIVKINKTKSWFFEKINKFGKSLARLIKEKKRKESTQQN